MYRPYESDLTEQILGASPVELTQLLYAEARRAISRACVCTRMQDPAGRSQAVSRAMDIVTELNSSLDLARGGDLSQRLRTIYTWVLEQLASGHVSQSESLLRGAEEVLAVLEQAWDGVRHDRVGLTEAPAGNAPVQSFSFAA